ncbi:acyl-CoA dehydrogenase family protein [Paraburkholderia sp. BL17N1]|uniref:acyl-CoA dehydrogenase family protein n=1 Tax=Paraburkholderia sp. BL17N1 TaxID=1938798 RepID=UPI000EAC8736|nr:acyl-CoA dehydrogenase family protein [Paraburkholderia sp. BL17N1]RKR37772.1 hypothetical protein B0G82_5881 [Paraburkholderia sp. BL17N1]
MNFQLNSEQQMLQDSVRRYIARACAFDRRTAQVKAGCDHHARNWSSFAENGWLAAALPEEYGGLGGSLLDTVLIAQELGRGLVVDPFVGCAVLAVQTFVAAATPAQMDVLLPRIAEGTCRIALAYQEASSRGNPAVVETLAARDANGFRLHGQKTAVLGAPGADQFIVSARIGGNGASGDHPALFLVDATTQGVTVRPVPLHDGSWAAQLQLDGVQVGQQAVLGDPGCGLSALRHGLAHGTAALCAELVGSMEAAVVATAEFLRVRKQFGVPIGSFQALQHRMADMAAEMELARSMLYVLLASLENDDEATRQHTVSAAKALIGRTAKQVCGQAIQLHGGIGMTEEYTIGHYFKRAVVGDLLYGTSDQHDAYCAASLRDALSLSTENA